MERQRGDDEVSLRHTALSALVAVLKAFQERAKTRRRRTAGPGPEQRASSPPRLDGTSPSRQRPLEF